MYVAEEQNSLIPYPEERVPGPCGDGHPVVSDPQAADPVVVAGEDPGALAFQCVPNVAVEIVVASQEQSARLAECDRRDTADNVVMRVYGQLLVRANIEKSAGGVIGASSECKPIREEVDRIDIRLMAGESLSAHSVADIPQF